MKNTDSSQNKILVEVSQLYYMHNLSQQQIADRLTISRPSVSRLLQQARDAGIVHVEIRDPDQKGTQLGKELKETYHLQRAIIVPSFEDDPIQQKRALGIAAAQYLNEILEPDTILGVAWGTTIQETMRHLTAKKIRNLIVVQLIGGVAKSDFDTHASEIIQKIGKNFQATPYLLPLPTIVENNQVKQALMSDSHIQYVLNLAIRSEIALFSVGVFDENALLAKADLLNASDMRKLTDRGVVGDICAHFVTQQGEIGWPDLDARTIGIDLSHLKKKKHAVAVAGGSQKKSIIRAALLGRYCNTLITDENVASALIEDIHHE